MDRRLALSAMLFAAANLLGDEKKDDANTKVTGTVTVPKVVDSLGKKLPDAHPFAGDPFAAGPGSESAASRRR